MPRDPVNGASQQKWRLSIPKGVAAGLSLFALGAISSAMLSKAGEYAWSYLVYGKLEPSVTYAERWEVLNHVYLVIDELPADAKEAYMQPVGSLALYRHTIEVSNKGAKAALGVSVEISRATKEFEVEIVPVSLGAQISRIDRSNEHHELLKPEATVSVKIPKLGPRSSATVTVKKTLHEPAGELTVVERVIADNAAPAEIHKFDEARKRQVIYDTERAALAQPTPDWPRWEKASRQAETEFVLKGP